MQSFKEIRGGTYSDWQRQRRRWYSRGCCITEVQFPAVLHSITECAVDSVGSPKPGSVSLDGLHGPVLCDLLGFQRPKSPRSTSYTAAASSQEEFQLVPLMLWLLKTSPRKYPLLSVLVPLARGEGVEVAAGIVYVALRSPEPHAQGLIEKPSDIFSFGIVCIFAILHRVIFYVAQEDLAEDEEPLSLIIERQISYFANEEGLAALLEHLGAEKPWRDVFKALREGFNKTNPRRPFALWRNVDPQIKDLVQDMTNFDPAKRITAHEALAHPWFGPV
ncbi:MAG: hypothetical protein M1818_003500 [Claussenomyces sp. TS43310]|nr:MAG: hypothetical protein M1818_003500 [Claussenomyces sp. TS43310]